MKRQDVKQANKNKQDSISMCIKRLRGRKSLVFYMRKKHKKHEKHKNVKQATFTQMFFIRVKRIKSIDKKDSISVRIKRLRGRKSLV